MTERADRAARSLWVRRQSPVVISSQTATAHAPCLSSAVTENPGVGHFPEVSRDERVSASFRHRETLLGHVSRQ
jgi:hypothetical protein